MANFEDFNFGDFKELVDSTKSDLEKLKYILIGNPNVFKDYVKSTNIVSAFDTLAPIIEDMALRYNLGRYIFSAVIKKAHPEEVHWSINNYCDGGDNVQKILDSYDNDELAELLRYYFEHVKNSDASYITGSDSKVRDSKKFDFSELISSIKENCKRVNAYFYSDPITFESFVDTMKIEEIYDALSLSGMQSNILIYFGKLIKNFNNIEFNYDEYLKLLWIIDDLIFRQISSYEWNNSLMNFCCCIVHVANKFKDSRGWEPRDNWMSIYFYEKEANARAHHQK